MDAIRATAAENTLHLTEREHQLPSNKETTGNLHGISVTQLSSRPLYRLRDDRWEEKTLNGSWKPTDRFNTPDLGEGTWQDAVTTDKIPKEFIQVFNTVDSFIKKKADYQKQLENLPDNVDPDTVQLLRHRIAVTEKEISYRKAMTSRLYQSPTSDDSKIRALEDSWHIYHADQLNNSDTKIGLIAEQLEQDNQRLIDYKNRSAALQTEVAALNLFSPELLRAIDHLNQGIIAQRSLMEARVSYAELLPPPSQTITLETKVLIENNYWNCVAKNAQAQSCSSRAQQEIRNFRGTDGGMFTAAIHSFDQINSEAQKSYPNQQIIDWLTHSVELYQQVVSAFDTDQRQKALYLNKAGLNFTELAQEAQKPTPNQQVIDCFEWSALLYQQAAAALDGNQINKARYLGYAGKDLAKAALETQKLHPSQHVIDDLIRNAEVHEKMARAFDRGQITI